MGGVGRWIGAVWFLVLFLAAITSSFAMLQPVMAFVEEALGASRTRAAGLLTVAAFLGSLWVIYFSKDLVALDTMDFWVGTTLIFMLATVQIVCFAWVFGIDRGLAEAHEGALLRIPRVFRFVMKYVAPAYLIVVFAGFCWQTLADHLRSLANDDVARWTMTLVATLLAILVVMTRAGEQRWRAAGLDVDGLRPPDDA
jgi:neurotransmitter:Na+ symporter, NSS family